MDPAEQEEENPLAAVTDAYMVPVEGLLFQVTEDPQEAAAS